MTRFNPIAAMSPLLALLVLQPGAAQLPHIVVERNLPLKLVDGTTLYADVYRPESAGRFPALLMRTPYDKEGAQQSGRLAMTVAAVRRGYVVVVQDTRGQFKSEGRFVPYSQEISDGHETIAWVAALPYVDGQVGMFGLSYPGAVQWMTAPDAPPALKAIAPAMTFAHPNHFFYHGGIFEADFIEWLLPRQIRERRQFGLPLRTSDEIAKAWAENGEAWMDHRPLAELPIMKEFAYWDRWTRNPIHSRYWTQYDIEAKHARVTVPALNLSGWNDDPYGQPGAVRNFAGMKERGGSDAARRGQRLIMGPWTHGVPSLSRTAYAGTDFGPNATFDFVEEQLRFFDYWLKKQDPGFSREPAVRIFVMGDNRWREEETWPIARTAHEAWQLMAGGTLVRGDSQARTGRTAFVYDPRTPARVPLPASTSAADWSAVTSRADVVEFTSEPLGAPAEITGHIVAHLWFTSSAPDTDVTARILAVRPDGSSYALTNTYGALRARYRSTEAPQPEQRLPAGKPVELTISLGYTSIVVPAGERLQVAIAGSLRQGLTIHPNVWEISSPAAQPAPATNVVHHGPELPSRVILPVIPRRQALAAR
jgi:putative CocE/NonD family hydrolase